MPTKNLRCLLVYLINERSALPKPDRAPHKGALSITVWYTPTNALHPGAAASARALPFRPACLRREPLIGKAAPKQSFSQCYHWWWRLRPPLSLVSYLYLSTTTIKTIKNFFLSLSLNEACAACGDPPTFTA